MRSRAKHQKLEHIVNLAIHLVGKKRLAILKEDDGWQGLSGTVLFESLELLLMPVVQKMNDDTLGAICGYGDDLGWLVGSDAPKEKISQHFERPFVRISGLRDVFPPERIVKKSLRNCLGPRKLMEFMAVGVLVCFVRDILLQDRYHNAPQELTADLDKEDSFRTMVEFWEKQRKPVGH